MSVLWKGLQLPAPLTPAAAQAVLLGLASLPGDPRLVLEAIGRNHRVTWRLGADDDLVLRRACQVVRTHLPETLVVSAPDRLAEGGVRLATQVRFSRSRQLPLGGDHIATVCRSVLAALAAASPHETVLLQVVLGGRRRPRRVPDDHQGETSTRALADKHAQYAFGCALRIAAQSGHEARVRQLINDVAAGLRGLERPGVSLRLTPICLNTVSQVRSPFLWPLELSTGDLVPLLGWPVAEAADAELPGVPPRHPRLLPALPVHPTGGGDAHSVVGIAAANLLSGSRREVAQPLEDTLRHRHVMGVTGTGKSTLLARLVLQDIAAGRGVVVIDPKTDLVDRVLERIPPVRLDDVVVLDPSSPTPVGVNPLAGVDPDLAADSVVSVFHSLFGSGLGPRSTDILHASVLSLARSGAATSRMASFRGRTPEPDFTSGQVGGTGHSLVEVPLLLTTPGLRRSVVGRVATADPFGLGSFWATFEAWSDGERELAIRPLMNKLRQVMLRPSLRTVFGQRQPAFQLRQIFDEQKILLVKLGKDSIGPEAASLLGSLLVNQLWQTALGRVAVQASQRHPVTLVIDEVQDYLRLPGSLGDALAQARGLGLSVTAAHQHRAQLGKLLEDVEANAVTKLYFRLAARDAREVASTHGSGLLQRDDFLSLPAFHAYGQLLVDNALTPWVSLATEPLSPSLHDARKVQQTSEARYGRSLDEVERDLLNLLDAPAAGTSAERAATERPGRRRPTSADADGGDR